MAHGHGDGAIMSFIKKDAWDIEWWGSWGISRAFMLTIVYAGELTILTLMVPNVPFLMFSWVVATAPIWAPIAMFFGCWVAWMEYVHHLYLSGRHPILLEMKIPREITKSPRAMELALSAFSISSGETTFIHRAWKGQVRPFFSFEIASFGGEIHFYIWCWQNYRATVETAIYSQYPEVEIYEVEDYATKWQFDPKHHNAWGVEWPLTTYMGIKMEDPRINAYPLKTYVDFELDKDPKEEHKIDPLVQVLEFMSAIQPNEQLWVQIVMRKSGKIGGILNPHDQDTAWKATVEREVQRLRARAAIVPGDVLKEVFEEEGEHLETTRQPTNARPSWKHQQMMESMERNLGKYPFEVGVRGIYWVTDGDLRGPIYTGFRWMWRPFGNPQYGTQLRPRRWHCDFDYPWQDINNIRWNNTTRRVHDAYRRRSFFYVPWHLPTNIMTNEVIASLWHPPSRTATVPGLTRIPATKVAAPTNLPM